MVAYFLPLEGGAVKDWGTATEDFWCCHGTLVQAHTRHSSLVVYRGGDDSVVVAQYISARAGIGTDVGAADVNVELLGNAGYVGPDSNAAESGDLHRPRSWQRSGDGADSGRLSTAPEAPDSGVGRR